MLDGKLHNSKQNNSIKLQCIEQQTELLTSCFLGGDDANRTFSQSITLQLKGNLSLPALESTINLLVQRHESLRTIFDIADNSFLILEKMHVPLVIHTLSAAELQDEKKIENYLVAESLHIFDLAKGPLMKASLLTDGAFEHNFLLTLHHVVCDGWTLGVIVRELAELYNYSLDPTDKELKRPFSFNEYAGLEHRFTQSKAYDDMKDFWLKELKNYVPASVLPYDYPRPKNHTYKTRHINYTIGEETFSKIKEAAKVNSSSVLVTMASILEVLLYKISGKQEFVIGIPAGGQPVSGFDDLVGHCATMLPVITQVDGELNFSGYLNERKTRFSNFFANKRVTFGTLLKTMKLSRETTAIPLIPISFNIFREMMEGLVFNGLEAKLYNIAREYSSFEIIMNLCRKQNEIIIEFDYREALFDRATMFNFLNQFEYLAGQLCSENDRSIDDISLYNLDELKAKLQSWNHTTSDFPEEDTFCTLFEKTVALSPDKIALVFNQKSYAYKKLNEEANRMARVLINAGLKPGDFAGVMLERGAEMLISLLAVMKAGSVYIPIDPAFPPDRISFMLEDAHAKILITSAAQKTNSNLNSVIITIEDAITKSKDMETGNLNLNYNPADLAYMIYTSGSTGKPKGVMIEHKSLVNLLSSIRKKPGFNADDKLLAITTISFDIAGLELYLPLLCGGTLVLADAKTIKDGQLLLKMIQDEKITVMQATPATYRLMLANVWEGSQNLTLLCGGESLSLELAKKLVTKCKALWNMYGPTETTIWSTIKKISESDDMITIGKPIDNTEIYILDDKLALIPEGATGEICIAGAGIARGYLNRDVLTDEKFIVHPINPEMKIYRTGDLGKIAENGDVLCLGRIDTQIKVRGYRIETGEIEHTLSKVENIIEAVVLTRENKKDDIRLIAFIVPESTNQLEFKNADGNTDIKFAPVPKHLENEWKAQLALALPEYMIPSGFIFLKHLPLTPNGKIDRKPLSDCDISNMFSVHSDHGSELSDKQNEKVWTVMEKELKAIWEETLGISNARLSDNFFESGGHSLIGIELINKIEKRLLFKLPLSSLFAHPTISGLASIIEKNEKPVWKYLVPIKPGGSKPPFYLVHGAGLQVMLFNHLAPSMDDDQPFYGIQAIGLVGDDALPETLEEIASNYVREIIAHNPEGPYSIAGFSAGFVIAFEMAKQLKAQGRTVSFLGNFDFSKESLRLKAIRPIDKLKRMVTEFFPRSIHIISNLIKYPSKAHVFQRNFMYLRFKGILRRLGFDIKDQEPVGMEKIHLLMDQYQKAVDNYEFTPYNGSINLFRTRIKLYYLKDRQYLGWKKYALQGIKIHPVESDHDNMILPPNNLSFARKLQEALDINMDTLKHKGKVSEFIQPSNQKVSRLTGTRRM